MSAAERRLVLLDDRFPTVSRMTRYRIEQEADFPDPIIVRGRKYYDDAELTVWEESRRRCVKRTPKFSSAEAGLSLLAREKASTENVSHEPTHQQGDKWGREVRRLARKRAAEVDSS